MYNTCVVCHTTQKPTKLLCHDCLNSYYCETCAEYASLSGAAWCILCKYEVPPLYVSVTQQECFNSKSAIIGFSFKFKGSPMLTSNFSFNTRMCKMEDNIRKAEENMALFLKGLKSHWVFHHMFAYDIE